MSHKSVALRVTAVSLLFIGLLVVIVSTTGRTTAQVSPEITSPTAHLTSNGIWLESGLPLPVFQFLPPQVSADGSVRPLGGRFSAIGRTIDPIEEPYLNQPRFTVFNEQTNSVLEQYGATGGFYAYNPTEAFGETPRGGINPVVAQQLACQVLYGNNLMLLPDNNLIGTPDVQFCDYNFSTNPYGVSLIQAAAADANGRSISSVETIGIVVQVPMVLKTGQYSQIPEVELGGAGGHISLLFRTTDFTETGFSLDDQVPGLGAVAMPFYSRSLQFLNNFPTRDLAEVRAEVEAQVEDSYPDATDINVPPPALRYMAGDAAQVQSVLEPMFEFEDIEVEVDGETIILRSVVVPALVAGSGGFGPDVAIISPDEGSSFMPETAVTLIGSISAGQAPYTYTWSLSDGAVLAVGASAAPGEISTTATDLPVESHGGLPAALVVLLEVEDSLGAIRQDTLTLFPTVAPAIYLPAVLNESAGSALAQPLPRQSPQAITAVYRFGVHAGSDYPPYGPGGADLPGVIPDATGFRTSMLSYGWTSTYNWWNASAWEKDWRDCSLGGIDCTSGVDRVDFAYYAGHAGPGGLSLPSNKDSTWFDGANARYSTLRWAGFAACQPLRVQGYAAGSEPIRRWFGAFQGAHMLLGYNSNMRDVAFGPRLVDNMRPVTFLGITLFQRSIREAWVQTAFQMNAGKPAYLYAIGTNGVNPVNNKLPRSGDPALPRPYPVASYNWVWWNE
jgi:hypothetical protein